MNNSLFHDGHELFQKFNISLESVITYTDFCQEMIFARKNDIKFTPKALLMMHNARNLDDWIEEEVIEFCPWNCVQNIQNIDGITVLQEFNYGEIAKWLSTLTCMEVKFPFLKVRMGNIACIFEGMPKSVRSKGGKQRLKQEVNNLKSEIQRNIPSSNTGYAEIMIDIFSSDPKGLPDVDRLSISIMDAFEGIVYANDKQVRRLQPRVIESGSAYRRLECATDPMALLEIENIPVGSLYPLATGVLDYYVVRILTYH